MGSMGGPRREPLKRAGSGRTVVAGLGQCSLDFLCTIPEYPEPDTKCEFLDFLVQGGGPVATALVVLARWGVSTRFAGLVCRDRFGEEILDGLADEGIDTKWVVTRETGRSQVAMICAEPESGRRTIFWGRPEGPPLAPEEIPPGLLEGADVLLLDGLFLEVSLGLARRARERGIPVVLDAGSLRPGMLDLVRLTDHLIAAENFFRAFRPGKPAAERLDALRRMGPELVAVTLGKEGSLGSWGEGAMRLGSLPVRAVDTTGAGDVFHGAYIYALLEGLSPPDRLRWATVAASLSCRRLGGRSGIPRREEVEARMAELGAFTPVRATTEEENQEITGRSR